MLTDTGPVAKLYLSIIDDVIDSMRELFLDEGLEDRVLDDLRHLWETKMIQSKAMEGFGKNDLNSSNFVLQLPTSYTRPEQKHTSSVVIPANQNIPSFLIKNNLETFATFSLPAGLTYPVQIPAGVTLQTDSGQLYKVNVPVVVTQAPLGLKAASQPLHKVTEQREGLAPQPAPIPPNSIPPQEPEPSSVPTAAVTEPNATSPAHQRSSLSQCSPEQEVPAQENKLNTQTKVVNLDVAASPCTQLLNFQISQEEALARTSQSRDIEDILKEVIEEETEKAERARSLDGQTGAALRMELDYSYSQLSEIIQLDGAADNSDHEEEEASTLEENDFLGIINAETIKALQEENGSSDDSISSSSDSEAADEVAHIEDEDPLNSGDDVVEQDIPDLFDTDNIIVCQFDKIHRSKNRWKFHLKDGVMCYGGRDYMFSKAVGEAEW
ncbi:TFIIA-alpha and beta-like factor [Pholidichthys leucotaenia]